MSKEKFYVVWSGVNPGIYTSWTDCQLQTKGYEGAKYKSFETREEAEKAFESSPYEYIKRSSPDAPAQKKDVNAPLPSSVVENGHLPKHWSIGVAIILSVTTLRFRTRKLYTSSVQQ